MTVGIRHLPIPSSTPTPTPTLPTPTPVRPAMLLLVFVFVFLDVLGFALVLPLLPYLGEELSAGPSLASTLLTANAAAQLVGAPLLGSMSDTIGRRPVLIFAAVWTCLAFALLGAAPSLPLALASRVIDGLLGGDVSLALAYVSDITTPETRARGLGAVGAAFGLAFILGPVAGGILVSFHLRAPAYVAAAIAAVNALALAAWLPESLPSQQQKNVPAVRSLLARWDPLTLLRGALGMPGLGPLLALRAAYSLMFIGWEAAFASHYKARYGFSARSVSYGLGLVALMYAVVQGGAIAALTKTASVKTLASSALGGMGSALIVWLCPIDSSSSLGVMAFFGIMSGIANTLLNQMISLRSPPDRFGSALTLSSAVGSLVRVLAPLIVSLSHSMFDSQLPAVSFCALCGLSASVYAALCLPSTTSTSTSTAIKDKTS